MEIKRLKTSRLIIILDFATSRCSAQYSLCAVTKRKIRKIEFAQIEALVYQADA